MAQLKADYQKDIENKGHDNLLPSKNADDAPRKHTIKKQAFGELKNVMHNQCPQKGSKSTEKPNKEYVGLFQTVAKLKMMAKTRAPPPASEDDDIEMLNYLDHDRKCCRKPYKSDRQIWADMNMFDDDMLDNMLKTAFSRDEDDAPTGNDSLVLDKSDSEDTLDINNSGLIPFVFSSHDDSSDDIVLPPVELEKFDFY